MRKTSRMEVFLILRYIDSPLIKCNVQKHSCIERKKVVTL